MAQLSGTILGALFAPFLDSRLFAIIIFCPQKIANKIAKHENTCDISFTLYCGTQFGRVEGAQNIFRDGIKFGKVNSL